jgi:hypothetical protein
MGNNTQRENMSWILAGADKHSGKYRLTPVERLFFDKHTMSQKDRAQAIVAAVGSIRWP